VGKSNPEYIPALGFRGLTPFYDLIQRWVVRDERFKVPLIEQAGIHSGQLVLDLGCGTGTLAIMVKRAHPGAEVVGLDADPHILRIAAAKAERAGVQVKFDRGMAFDLPYQDRSFDRILSSLMIHHLKTPEKHKTARELYRVLRPGGELHVVDFGKPRTLYGRLLGVIMHGFEEVADNMAGRLPEIFAQGGFSMHEGAELVTFFGSLTFLSGKKA